MMISFRQWYSERLRQKHPILYAHVRPLYWLVMLLRCNQYLIWGNADYAQYQMEREAFLKEEGQREYKESIQSLQCEYVHNLAVNRPELLHSYKWMQRAAWDRKAYILERCKNKHVLHFGFLDAPYTQQRIKDGTLLHLQLRDATEEKAIGIDIDQEALECYMQLTDDKNCLQFNVLQDDMQQLKNFRNTFDYILVAETLEHIPDPVQFLRKLHQLCEVFQAQLIVTVPSVFYWYTLGVAAQGYEHNHPDHYHLYTPRTLEKQMIIAGFFIENMMMYSYGDDYQPEGIQGDGIIAIAAPQRDKKRILFILSGSCSKGIEESFINIINLISNGNLTVETLCIESNISSERCFDKNIKFVSLNDIRGCRYDIAIKYDPLVATQLLVDDIWAGRRFQWIHADTSYGKDTEQEYHAYKRVDKFICDDQQAELQLTQQYTFVEGKTQLLQNISDTYSVFSEE